MSIKTPVSATSFSQGFAIKRVKINGIDDKGIASCDDGSGNLTAVNTKTARAKGALPQVGEVWFIAKDLGSWSFAAIANYLPNQGIAILADAATSVSVTLPTKEVDADYGVSLTPSYNAVLWYTTRTTTGFTIHASTGPGGAAPVTWQLLR